MRLERGCIYSARYRRYRVDPTPVLLILWWDEDKVHALNLNYLDASKVDEISHFVARHLEVIITKYDAYTFYHRYMKRQARNTITAAYRTYFTRELRNIRRISNHPLQSMNVLRGFEKARIESEAKGVKPATSQNPVELQQVVGPAHEPQMVADYIDMLDRVSPKRERGGIFTRLFGKRRR